ncbi:MAG TPA: multifunctional CCA addition/repair protein [Nitrococcus sp.]|nr:multifunctional CCA addition/repair protein [Nitrococcus sp.]
MEIYLVGGAVRDHLLGLPVRERDWVVVGAEPADLIARGFRPVGREFPVFIHPETGEEYALARTERKVGRGYHGFTFHASPDVTLEQDLQRRDLTINALAQDGQGRIIDPFGGRRDLERRVLRHTSLAFCEDPVRILRLARFAARFEPLGFTIAEDTLRLCREMVVAGEVDALVPERVWQELARALMEPVPSAFIRVLRECSALQRLLPELDRLFGVPQRADFHPEVDAGVHVLLALDQSVQLSDQLPVRFAVLLHDLGKGATPLAELPRHRGHEKRGVALVETVCRRLRVPNACRDLAKLVARHHLKCHRALDLRPATIVALLEALDAFRRVERLPSFLAACEADARGRAGFEHRDYPPARYLNEAYQAATAISIRPLLARGLQGQELGQALQRARIDAVACVRRQW